MNKDFPGYGKKVRTPFQAEGQAKESCRYVSLLPLYPLAATLQAIQLGFLLLFTLAQVLSISDGSLRPISN